MAWTIQKLQESFDLTDREALTIIAIVRGRLDPWDYPDHPWWKDAMNPYVYLDMSRHGVRAEARMAAIDKILHTCGVEAIENEDGGFDDPYWGSAIALYCNAGDTYAPTILYDIEACRYKITTWGDWYEANEAKPDYSGDGHFGCDHGGL